jgi:hypothetical protein
MIDTREAMANAMTEDELLDAVMKMAGLLGWRRYHVRNSKAGIIQGETGFPDLVLVRDGRIIFAELKRQNGRTSTEQQGWLVDLMGLDCYPGGLVAIWRPRDWLDGRIETELRRGRDIGRA